MARDDLEDRGIDERIIIRLILKKEAGECVDWIDLAVARGWRL
jgi:hypothetical protein